MDIKEIAQKLAPDYWKRDLRYIRYFDSVGFAEALIAEIAKQNEPLCTAAMLDEWFLSKSGVDPKLPLYTLPPTAEQIANETAEAIAEMCDEQEETYSKDIRTGDLYKATACEFITKRIRSGEWKKFRKGD